ncbi:MAG TPA: alpha/beta fold hydrolase, partial [Thermoanaerobaculia bacterium]|nr:alpha/beta fold hydrolase [Thermoanaerobaculia bacterium]
MEQLIDLPPHSFWIRIEGEGTPLILLHGLSGSFRWWDRNVTALAARHRVIAVDLIGFGRNRRFLSSDLPLSFGELAGLLTRWIERELREPVHLVAHSMGGGIALRVASSRPDLIRSLTLVSSAGIPVSLDPLPRLEALLRPPRGIFSFAPRLAADALRAGPSSIAFAAALLFREDARESMRAVRAPTLLMWGENDPFIPLRHAEEIHAEIPGSDLVVIARAGHVPMWDQPREFNAKLLEFTSRVESVGSVSTGGQRPRFQWAIADCREGICWRRSGSRPSVILIHGLGIGSRYFHRLSKALYERGVEVAAPDLPDLGFSDFTSGKEESIEVLAARLLSWSREAGIEKAVWLGHSTGAQVVAHAARLAPDRVSRALYLGPIWTRRPAPWLRLALLLVLDATRESLPLIAEATWSYWKSGLITILRKAGAYRADLGSLPPVRGADIILIGDRDPLVDRNRTRESGLTVRQIPGAHGALF